MREAIQFVGIFIEVKDSAILSSIENQIWLTIQSKYDSNCIVDIRGEFSKFKTLLSDMDNAKCSQALISYVKEARDMGAANIMFIS